MFEQITRVLYARSKLRAEHDADRRQRDLDLQATVERERKLARGAAFEEAFTIVAQKSFDERMSEALKEISERYAQDVMNVAWTIYDMDLHKTPVNARYGKLRGDKLALIGARNPEWQDEESVAIEFGGRRVVFAIPRPPEKA